MAVQAAGNGKQVAVVVIISAMKLSTGDGALKRTAEDARGGLYGDSRVIDRLQVEVNITCDLWYGTSGHGWGL